MIKKTKILAIGDIHGDTGLVKKLAEKAKKENIKEKQKIMLNIILQKFL